MLNWKRTALVLGCGLLATTLAYADDRSAAGDKKAGAKAGGGIETAVLVLDASGSMNSKVNDQVKMAAAKDAVIQLVQGWDKSVPLGLTVYGHRKSSCDDIESVIPVGTLDIEKFKSTVNGLKANGATPLTEAVIQAAEQLDYEHNQATIILVSDGEESCGGDPCEMAKKLESMGIDLTVHVVGFGVTQEQADSGLSCIAKNTGGQYKTATDAAQLNEALKGMVQDADDRKVRWRQRWGKQWGTNGRWKSGFWHGGHGDAHRQVWGECRKHWRPSKQAPRRK
jgi:Mg-chelatase subunit ChlD